MLYAIYAYEGTYGGLHGMNDCAVVNCINQDEAEDIAKDMSYDVMQSYEDIMSSIYEDASDEYDEGTEDWANLVDELMMDNLAYEIYQVTDEHGKTLVELDKEFANDPESFISKYCSEI